ncbi:MAG TPA: arylsulfatase [Acidimicrobiales bacterium]
MTGSGIDGDDLPRRAAPGSPNVVVILFDDLGFAQLGCYGSEIATPALDGLAAGGLRYNRIHVTALCSPSRAALLTGRNHHRVGMGFLADMPLTQPGYTAHRPRTMGTLPRILSQAGYSSYAVGKWHLTPGGERSDAGPFEGWPLGWGFDRFYGFLQGDTNHWTPNLAQDNHYVEPPAGPEEGYHLSEDLADRAIRYVQDQHQAVPDKPFFLYLSFGAMHAPHHVATEWVEPYRGQFDDGWEAFRERAFARQCAEGIVPESAELTPRPSWVPAWHELDGDARFLFARMQETYAGFLSHTDAQIGRVLAHLEASGQLDNTIVLAMSDNGASAEGGVTGTVNEHRFSGRMPETVEQNLPYADDWGGFRTYSHYAWGWAWAGNTPFHLWKRYTWLGGTRSPLIVHWPERITDQGAVRGQLGHIVDLLPTVLDACGIELPDVVDGYVQDSVDGASLEPSFTDADAPNPRPTQYFEMLGSRSMIHNGWKATTNHVSDGVVDEERLLEGSREFETDEWQLFELDSDYSEARDVAAEHPDVLTELIELWDVEAERNHVLPMKDALTAGLSSMLDPQYPRHWRAVYRPGGPIRDGAVPPLGAGGTIIARVEVPTGDAEGVVYALGDWSGGFALFVRDGRPAFALNVGSAEVVARASEPLAPGARELAVVLIPAPDGTAVIRVSVDGAPVAEAVSALGVPFAFQHGGTALRIGHDAGFPVCDDYRCPFPWTGTIQDVTVDSALGGGPSIADTVRTGLHAD